MVSIRPVKLTDMIQIEYVCRMTAGPLSRKEPIVGNRVAKMYSTYYVRECQSTSFALVNSEDVPVGYILCEKNYKKFKKLYRKTDVPIVFSLKKSDGIKAWCLPIPYQFFGNKYPAHLHIDILPEYQGKGYGTKLVKALLYELKRENIKGIMLTADYENTGAVRFYERLGFKTLIKSEKIGGIIMGKSL